jgi:hypothetical protein
MNIMQGSLLLLFARLKALRQLRSQLLCVYLARIVLLLPVGGFAAVYDSDKQKQILVMGGSAMGLRNATKQDAEIAFNTLLDEELNDPNFRIHLVIYPTTQELYAAFDSGKLDGLFGSPLEYLGRANQLSEHVMALKFRGGGIKQSFVLVARRGEGNIQLPAFKNKRLTLSKLQDLEALYLNTQLLRYQQPEISEFFSSRLEAKNANIALMDVFFDKSDITVVRQSEFQTAVELNPQLGKKLIILDQSVPFLPVLGSHRKELDNNKITTLMKRIESMSDAGTGNKLLSITQAVALVVTTREELNSVTDLLREYNTLKQSHRQRITPFSLPAPPISEKRHAQ